MNSVNRARQLQDRTLAANYRAKQWVRTNLQRCWIDLARQRTAGGRATDELGACANLTALSGQVSEGG